MVTVAGSWATVASEVVSVMTVARKRGVLVVAVIVTSVSIPVDTVAGVKLRVGRVVVNRNPAEGPVLGRELTAVMVAVLVSAIRLAPTSASITPPDRLLGNSVPFQNTR